MTQFPIIFIYIYLYLIISNPISVKQYKNTAEAAVAGAKSIAVSCINSATVRRVIYTASVVAAAPLKDDETGFKDSMDESCWTPLNLPFSHGNSHLKASFSLTLMLNKILLEIQTVEREY